MAVVAKTQTSLQNAIKKQTEKLQKELEHKKHTSLFYILTGVVIMLISLIASVLWSWACVIGFFVGGYFLIVGMKDFSSNSKYLEKLIKGLEGERKVSELVQQVMPDSYRIVNDVRVPTNGRTTQIDHIVIGPQGILNIETKNWSVESKEINGRWMIQTGKGVVFKPLDPMKQSKYHENAIRSLLDKHVDIPQSVYEKLQIHTVVVFTDPDVKVETSSKENLYVFSCLEDFAEYLQFYQKRSSLLLDSEVEYLTKFFKQAHYKGEKSASMLEVEYSSITCDHCGKKVSEKVRDFCLKNEKRFSGKIYCYDHQKNR